MRHPDTTKEIFRDIWRSLKAEIPIVKEFKNFRKNGSVYWARTLFSPEYNINKELIGYSAIKQDITDKKEVEELKDNLEVKVIERTQDLNEAKQEIEIAHKNTKDSIEYASLIQQALIPDTKVVGEFFTDSFLWWSPKDIVGGDIFLFEKLRHDDECLFMVIDCAGHGVPGAFVTMLVKAIERELVAKISKSDYEVSTSIIMGHFNRTIKKLLQQYDDSSISNAGFDGAIVYIDKQRKILRFSGAYTELFYLNNDTVDMKKGSKQSVGYKQCDNDYVYNEIELELCDKTRYYLSTDGYLDQKGGEKGFSFGKKKFKKLIEDSKTLPLNEQQDIFKKAMDEYQDSYFRVDDITVFGWEI
jgi:serine phosphatase RsbU (regulator of sigma subunit)